MRSKAFLIAGIFILGCSQGGSQVKGKPDQSVSDARKISPFPPKGVSIKAKGKQTIITWDPIPLDNIVAYKIYRKVGDSSFTYIGTVEHPPFIDKKVASRSVSYGVAAVNSYKAESAMAMPTNK
jgi:hypothetical protein